MDGYFLYVINRLDKIRTGDNPGKSGIFREIRTWDLWRAVFAEFVATMLFVFIGTMSAVGIETLSTGEAIIRIAFTFGLMIAICIQMIGHVSGGHINPAVSIAMAVTFNITPVRAVLYVVAQVVGGIVGSALLKAVTPEGLHINLGLTTVSSQIDAGQAFGCEVIFTFILVTSIYGCTDGNRPLFGSPALGIGLTITVCHLAGIPFTGASMNPARSLASAVVSDVYDDHWVYWVGPILGGVIAGLMYKFILDPYRGCMSYTEASNKLLSEEDMMVVPRSILRESNGKPFGKMDQQASLHL